MGESASESDGLLTRLRMPVAVLLALVLMVGAYYTLHYRANADYIASRNFRLLATMATQVQEAVRNEGVVFGNLANDLTAHPDAYETLSPNIEVLKECPSRTERSPNETTSQGKLWRSLSSAGGAYRLVFDWQPEGNRVCGAVEIKELLDPLFSSRPAFEAVLLAKGAGKEVVYLRGPKSLRVEKLDLLIQNRRRAKPDKEEKEDKGAAAFQGYSGSAEVELGGRIYTAFVQPVSLSLEEDHQVWLLAGLVSKDELAATSLALSPSAVAFLLGILLLAALAWPLVKLKLLGERQRVKKADVLLVGVCSLLGVSVATLFVLDLGAYRVLKSAAEVQLKDFAEQMESNLLVEIRRAYDQLCALEALAKSESSLPAGYLQNAAYPYFESFAAIDPEGWQKVKLMAGSPTPPINVARRLYFERSHQGLTLLVPEPEKPAGLARPERRARSEPFFLESVQSWTTGEWQAVIAKPSVFEPLYPHAPHSRVAALAINMLSVIHPVVPPDFEFAVVGDDGTVLFHSDAARNLAENFFEETDQDRRFKSIVLARHDEALDLRYWGESYRAFAIPVQRLPWTIVAMRKQQVLERVNLDWLVTTLILVLLYLGVITLALAAVALLRPGYRAGWVWPDPERSCDYAKLVLVLAAFCLAFLIALFGLRGTGFLFGVSALLPVLAFVAAYLKLSPAGNGNTKKRAVEGFGVILVAVLALVLCKAPVELKSATWTVRLTVLGLLAGAGLLAAGWPRRWRELRVGAHLPISRSYPVLGLLLMLLAAVLPTAGFFKVAHRLQVNSFVRNGQLKMAKELSERAALLKATGDPVAAASELTVGRGLLAAGRKAASQPNLDSAAGLDFYGGAFFDTRLTRAACGTPKREDFEPLAVLLPPYSDYTAENREMLHNQTSDEDWKWCRSPAGDTLFDGEKYLGVRLASTIEPVWRRNGPLLAMAGLVPPQEGIDLVEETDRTPLSVGRKQPGNLALRQVVPGLLRVGGVLTLFPILLYALVSFVARRIFLLDVQEPLWTVAEGTLAPVAGRNLFLVRNSLLTAAQATAMNLEYLDLATLEVGGDAGGEAWAKRCRELVDSGCSLVVAGFEHRISDPAFNVHKLELLESLIELRERSLIVLSRVSPSRLFASEPAQATPASGAPATYERWRAVLSSFTLVEEDLRSRPAANGGNGSLWAELLKSFLRWRGLDTTTSESYLIKSPVLREESGSDPFLLRIAKDLDLGRNRMGREQLLEEFGERAQGYYGALWASCSRDERVVLGHLAEEGLVNAKNRRTVRRLMARGLIRRGPNLCLINESFRRFVASPVCREQVLSLEAAAGRSAWDRFHWPFSAALAACAALILVTQQELLDSTVAAVTGVSAGLPALVKILDLLGWKRGVKSA